MINPFKKEGKGREKQDTRQVFYEKFLYCFCNLLVFNKDFDDQLPISGQNSRRPVGRWLLSWQAGDWPAVIELAGRELVTGELGRQAVSGSPDTFNI